MRRRPESTHKVRSDKLPGEIRREHVRLGMAVLYRRRKALMDAVKMSHGCSDCGYFERPEALEWDHLIGSQKYREPGDMHSNSLARFLAEIAKCEVVCSNCHRIRSVARNGLARVPAARLEPDVAMKALTEGWTL